MDPQQQPQQPQQPPQPPAQPEPTQPPVSEPQSVPQPPEPVFQPQPLPGDQQPLPPAGQQVQSDENPGQTLGIVSIVLSALGISIIGIILGVVSRNKSKKAGKSTTLGTVGLVLGIIGLVLGLIWFVLAAVLAYNGVQSEAAKGVDSSFQSQ